MRAACARNDEAVPESDAELVRCIVDSMALAIAGTLEEAQQLANHSVRVVHVVGGGVANELLLGLIAATTGLDVVAGPWKLRPSATCSSSCVTAGQVGDRPEMRALVSRSFPTKRYQPDTSLRQAGVPCPRRRLSELASRR